MRLLLVLLTELDERMMEDELELAELTELEEGRPRLDVEERDDE